MEQFGDAHLLFWGGNNVLGGNSYLRFPLNVDVGDEELLTFRNIQNLYSRYSLQGLAGVVNKVMNQKLTTICDTLYITWSNNEGAYHPMLRVDNFTDYLYSTKGAFDSFENSTVKHEG